MCRPNVTDTLPIAFRIMFRFALTAYDHDFFFFNLAFFPGSDHLLPGQNTRIPKELIL